MSPRILDIANKDGAIVAVRWVRRCVCGSRIKHQEGMFELGQPFRVECRTCGRVYDKAGFDLRPLCR